MTNYSTLVGAKTTAGSILNWSNVTRVDPATCLALAEAQMLSGIPIPGTDRVVKLRVREMLKSADIPAVIDDMSLSLPTRFLDPVSLRDRTHSTWVQNIPAVQMTAHRVYDESDDLYTGIPEYFSIYDELINFEVALDEDTSYTLLYYERPAPLSVGNPTNFLTDRYPQALLWCACAFAHDFDNDRTRYADYMGRVLGVLKGAEVESDLTLRGAMFGNEVP